MIFISNKKFQFDERNKERYFCLKLFKKRGIMAVEIVTDQEFKNEISGNDKVVVKYFADWCGNCRLFAPKFRRLSDDDRFDGVRFIDVNAEKNPEARKAAGVTNLPFFAVFKKGELVEGVPTSKEEVVVDLIGQLN